MSAETIVETVHHAPNTVEFEYNGRKWLFSHRCSSDAYKSFIVGAKLLCGDAWMLNLEKFPNVVCIREARSPDYYMLMEGPTPRVIKIERRNGVIVHSTMSLQELSAEIVVGKLRYGDNFIHSNNYYALLWEKISPQNP